MSSSIFVQFITYLSSLSSIYCYPLWIIYTFTYHIPYDDFVLLVCFAFSIDPPVKLQGVDQFYML